MRRGAADVVCRFLREIFEALSVNGVEDVLDNQGNELIAGAGKVNGAVWLFLKLVPPGP